MAGPGPVAGVTPGVETAGVPPSVPPSSVPLSASAGRGGMLRRLFLDMAGSPAVLFAGGNLVWSFATAEPWGVGLNIAVASGVAGARLRDSLTGSRTGIPFYIIAATNALTALSVLANGAMQMGVSEMFNVAANPEARKCILSAVAFAGWTVAHFLFGLHEKKDARHRTVLGNPQVHAGYADVAIVQADAAAAVNLWSLGFMVAGFARALCETRGDEPVRGLRDFAVRHATPARLYGAGYMVGALMALGNPLYAAAQALWGIGYLVMYADRNRDFWPDFKSVCGRKISAPPRPL